MSSNGKTTNGAAALGFALGLITLLSAITVVQRVLHVKTQLDRQSRQQ